MAYKRNIEIFEEAYTKKDNKSVLSYVSRDGKKRYISGSGNPDGGGDMPSGGGMTETTWQELKDKRDVGELTPGSLYRITDYNCTTTQEDTQSAGHQFDIVLLALSENELAEEGWAMEHPTDVYDVTFSDGVTKKCYLYFYQGSYSEMINMIDVNTMLGYTSEISSFTINEEQKTALFDDESSLLNDENLPYNYFQNSKLEAWKVWYCLDNDKSRFAWADDSVADKAIISFEFRGVERTIPRNESEDAVINETQYYAWGDPDALPAYTTSEHPVIGDKLYLRGAQLIEVSTIESVSEPTGLPNGRGVIFRLIDEWNNDCPYDFKNIQFIRKLTDGAYDEDEGTNTWCYTTGETALDIDLSIWHYPTHDLYISSFVDIGVEENTCKYFLPNNVFLIPASSKLYGTTGCTMMGAPLEMRGCRNVILGEGVSAGVYINCFEMSDNNDEKASFYFNNKVVILDTLGSGNSGDDATGR